MRILIISDAWHPQVNGVVRTYECIITELEKRGHTIRVIGPGDFRKTIPMLGYPEIRLVINPRKELKTMILDFKPDSLHIATEGPLGWSARRWCKKNKIPFSTSYHTHFPEYAAQRARAFGPFLQKPVHLFSKFFVKLFHKPSSLILVASPALKTALKKWNFKNEMHLFSRGVNKDLFHIGEKNIFKNLPKPIALYVGRIAIEKNINDFLKMPWEGSKIIVGDGPLLQKYSTQYPHVHFAGKRTGKDLADHYRSADIFVFPSRTDTFGIVILEALACGLPVAGYNVMGPKDIITEDFLGALDDTNLKTAVQKALACSTPEARASHIQNNYTWEIAAQQFEEALKRALISAP